MKEGGRLTVDWLKCLLTCGSKAAQLSSVQWLAEGNLNRHDQLLPAIY